MDAADNDVRERRLLRLQRLLVEHLVLDAELGEIPLGLGDHLLQALALAEGLDPSARPQHGLGTGRLRKAAMLGEACAEDRRIRSGGLQLAGPVRGHEIAGQEGRDLEQVLDVIMRFRLEVERILQEKEGVAGEGIGHDSFALDQARIAERGLRARAAAIHQGNSTATEGQIEGQRCADNTAAENENIKPHGNNPPNVATLPKRWPQLNRYIRRISAIFAELMIISSESHGP